MFNYIKNYVSAKMNEVKGQGMVEYALLLGLIAVVVVVVLVAFGPVIAAEFTKIQKAIAPGSVTS